MFGPARHVARLFGLPLGDRASRAWLQKVNNPYLGEIHRMAEALNLKGTYLLNVCFEWGCTSGAFRTPYGTLLRRVLDWPFPNLGESVVVAYQRGEAGDYYNITWPGLSGVYQGMAPGRFAAAINQAPMRTHGTGFIGDWICNRLMVNRSNGLPAAHLLRRVFELTRNYSEARQMLCIVPLAVPAIYILGGIGDDEGCVIERTENSFRVRDMPGCGRVCASNHFETGIEGRWLPRPIDSAGRLSALRAYSFDSSIGPFDWFEPPIANVNSRLVVNANSCSNEISVLGTAGIGPATEVFELTR